ncbi:MAG: phosphotransferase [Pelagibacteraceae bacterium]
MIDLTNAEVIKGDASFRTFFRKKIKNKSSIIIFAKKEKRKNLLIYDAINRILLKNNIVAPKLLSEKYSKGIIEIEDLGDKTVFQILKNKGINQQIIYKKIIKLLNKIQKIKDKKVKTFKKLNYQLKKYSRKTLYEEAILFCNWYVPRILDKKNLLNTNSNLRKQFKYLIKSLKFKNDTFVHRDFHVSNIMFNKKEFGLIDSQDALIGNFAYDLASLVDDVRFRTTVSQKNKIIKFFLKSNPKINKEKFKNDFEILSVLRNLKIIGIFSRLSARDKKNNYLKLIPYAWELINLRINQNRVFEKLKKILKSNFPKQIK